MINNLILASITVLLAVADILLTNRILAAGGKELNPVMRWCMDRCGKYWWAPKMVLTCLVVLVLLRSGGGHWLPLTVACAIQAGIVAWNIKEYRKQT